MYPVIKLIKVNSLFKYLWLKYVNGVDLNQHCAKCLRGEYSTQIQHTTFRAENIILNEHKANYFYLCGVSMPYRWINNFHLAFKYAKGKTVEVERNGIYIKILHAVEIPITTDSIDVIDHPKRFDKHFNTCRNWQFANMIAEENDA